MSESTKSAAGSRTQASCPRCQRSVPGLIRIDPGMRLRLQQADVTGVPPQVCQSCFAELTGQVSQGAKLRAEKVAEQQGKLILWKTRLQYVRQGRREFDEQRLSNAAVSLERYIKIVEVANDSAPNSLEPGQFKHPAKAKELPVLMAVWWDLFRIYDEIPRMSERQRQIGSKIAEFATTVPGGLGILRRMSKFAKRSKNREVVSATLRLANYRDASCFIATALYGSESCEVATLRAFRDEHLLNWPLGSELVRLYYWVSPSIARWLRRRPKFQPAVRSTFDRILLPLIRRFLLPRS